MAVRSPIPVVIAIVVGLVLLAAYQSGAVEPAMILPVVVFLVAIAVALVWATHDGRGN